MSTRTFCDQCNSVRDNGLLDFWIKVFVTRRSGRYEAEFCSYTCMESWAIAEHATDRAVGVT